MRFAAHERVLELFVGQNLYTSADAAIRELLQNAEDACSLQASKEGSGYVSAISIRFSRSQNWVEIVDNGIGMDSEILEESFLQVGRPKSEIPKLRELIERGGDSTRQIAQFGIGILSCFGVAARILVRTKMDDADGIAFEIPGLRDDFLPLENAPSERGTAILLQLIPGGPMNAAAVPDAARRYSRHAPHIVLEDVDEQTKSPLGEKRAVGNADEQFRITDQVITSGFLRLDGVWDVLNERFQSRIVVCNGGFLVTEREVALLRSEAIGYAGEIDVRPGALTILMNREGFKRDEAWAALAERLWQHYSRCLDTKIASWESESSAGTFKGDRAAVERALLLLTKGPTHGVLNPDLLSRSRDLLRRVLRLKLAQRDGDITLDEALEQGTLKSVLYCIEEGQGEREFRFGIGEAGSKLQVTETAQTRSLRTIMLQANGYTVLSLRRSQFSVDVGANTTTVTIRDFDVVQEHCAQRNIVLRLVDEAPQEHTHLGDNPEGRVIGKLFQLSDELKFVSIPNRDERVVRDFSGRLLNYSNPEIRKILEILPETVGNPIRRQVLQAYLDLTTFNLGRAREVLLSILTDPDFDEKAQLVTGALLKTYLDRRIKAMLEEKGN
jgi:hypothetical protein